MNSLEVAVGVILDSSKSKVLVAQRNTDDCHFGKWEFPGGKVNRGESVEYALRRELEEELGIVVTEFETFEHFDFQYSHRAVNLKFFLVTKFTGLPIGSEGQNISWVDVKDLKQLDMLEANNHIINKLMAQ